MKQKTNKSVSSLKPKDVYKDQPKRPDSGGKKPK